MKHVKEWGPGSGALRSTQLRALRGAVTLLAVSAMFALPGTADAGGKGRGPSTDGGINPTNTAVLESDFASSDMTTDSANLLTAEASLTEVTLEPARLPAMSPEEQICATQAHQVATGRGILVAVLDGGFNLQHPVFAGRLAPVAFDAIDNDCDVNDCGNGIDDNGDGVVDGGLHHGTFIAGMVLAAAPDATILPVRVRDDEGFGSNDELIAGIKFAVAAGAHVINLSVDSAGARRKRVVQTIADATDAGVVVVVASGNDSSNTLTDIAYEWGVIAAGAVDAADNVADFSNYTTDPRYTRQVFAPGVDLLGPVGADGCAKWSGTSFSAGFVSGGAALLLSFDPTLDPHEVGARLTESVDPVRLHGETLQSGGRLNLAKALGL